MYIYVFFFLFFSFLRYSYQFIDTEFTWNLVITSNAIKVELGNWELGSKWP